MASAVDSTEIVFKSGTSVTIIRKCAEVIQQMCDVPKVSGKGNLVCLTCQDGTPVMVLLKEILCVVPIASNVVAFANSKTPGWTGARGSA